MSLTVSLCPMCEPDGPMNVTCAPWSYAATSNAQRVRVESFSKISDDLLADELLLLAPFSLRSLQLGREIER